MAFRVAEDISSLTMWLKTEHFARKVKQWSLITLRLTKLGLTAVAFTYVLAREH